MKRDRTPGRIGFLLMLGVLAYLAVLNSQAQPPPTKSQTGPLRTNDLPRVPEVSLEAVQDASPAEARKHIARQIVKINHLNASKADGFLEALRGKRCDLRGLPFTMGDACRSKSERNKPFIVAAGMVRNAQEPVGEDESHPPSPDLFWKRFQAGCAEQDSATPPRQRQDDWIISTRIAVLLHVLAAKTEMHSGLVNYLSHLAHSEATRALARLAIFSGSEEVREAAIEALKGRREGDYTNILLDGLRYPWPAVAQRGADALARLQRRDLLPQFIEVLERPDPRAPVLRRINDKVVPVVREMVRLNHHRNCLLCHAPGNTGKVPANIVRAEVPLSGEPLRDRWEKCRKKISDEIRQDILVRIDVTYLRPDFSLFLAVADADPWPKMQRFDFLVRDRVLTEEEAKTYRDKLKPRAEGEFSPYQRAALTALRDLSGRDTAPTPQAWRRLLKLSAESPQTN